eukprot:12426459-Karenia_brevis.AAC.1
MASIRRLSNISCHGIKDGYVLAMAAIRPDASPHIDPKPDLKRKLEKNTKKDRAEFSNESLGRRRSMFANKAYFTQ